jgi:hypothetical protein
VSHTVTRRLPNSLWALRLEDIQGIQRMENQLTSIAHDRTSPINQLVPECWLLVGMALVSLTARVRCDLAVVHGPRHVGRGRVQLFRSAIVSRHYRGRIASIALRAHACAGHGMWLETREVWGTTWTGLGGGERGHFTFKFTSWIRKRVL